MSVVEEEVAVSLHQTADNGSGARRGPVASVALNLELLIVDRER